MSAPAVGMNTVAGATARAIRWTQPAVMAGIALLLVLWRADTLSAPATAVWTVRAAARVLVAGVLAVYDDAAAAQVAALPVPLSRRTGPRILFASTIVTVPVGALAWFARLPVGAILLEAAALLALVTAACLLLAQAGVLEPSMTAGIGLLLAPAAMYLLPERAALLVAPGPNWAQAHERWAFLLALGTLTVVVAVRDPAQPSPVRVR